MKTHGEILLNEENPNSVFKYLATIKLDQNNEFSEQWSFIDFYPTSITSPYFL